MGCSRFRIGKNLAGCEDLDESRGITCLLITGMILAGEDLAGAGRGTSNIGGEVKKFGKNLAGCEDLDESRGITCLLITGMILAGENLAGAVEGLSNIGGELKNFVKVLLVSGVLLCDHRIPK